jgi:hypothetical protein
MSVRVASGVVHLVGNCPVEDAEPLLVALLDGCTDVDLGAASRLHMAVAQLLVARRPAIVGVPSDPFLARHLLPVLGDAKPFRAAVDPL